MSSSQASRVITLGGVDFYFLRGSLYDSASCTYRLNPSGYQALSIWELETGEDCGGCGHKSCEICTHPYHPMVIMNNETFWKYELLEPLSERECALAPEPALPNGYGIY